jgi:hypothetical protein
VNTEPLNETRPDSISSKPRTVGFSGNRLIQLLRARLTRPSERGLNLAGRLFNRPLLERDLNLVLKLSAELLPRTATSDAEGESRLWPAWRRSTNAWNRWALSSRPSDITQHRGQSLG